MSLDAVLSFALIVTLMVISPGPNGALILKTVPTQGKRHGVANVCGFLTAFYLHGVFSVFGLSALIVGSARAFLIVKTLGALYLGYLGVKALWDAFQKQQSVVAAALPTPPLSSQSMLSAYSEGLITNLLNPKVSVFYLAAFPQFVGMDASLNIAGAFGLVSIHALVNFVWFNAMVLVVGRATAWMQSGWVNRAIKGLTGAVLLWFGFKLITAPARA